MTRSATSSNHSVCGVGLRQVLDSAKSSGTPTFTASRGTPWPIQILVAVGVPFLACFEAYEDMAGNEERELMGGVEAQRRYVDGVIQFSGVFVKASFSPPLILMPGCFTFT